MAMSAEERQVAIESEKILESYINDSDTASSNISEASGGLMVDLNEIENFLRGKELSYYGTEEMNRADGDIGIAIYLMSTKTVQVPPESNLIDLGFGFDINRNSVIIRDGYSNSTSLEKFIELPKANHSQDKLSAKDVVKMCDPDQIYNIYQDVALSIIRKNFTYAYHMFTGPNIYKKREEIIMTRKGPRPNTLYVMYDTIRKKFRYSYNPKFILECAIEEWMLQRGSYKSFEACYTYILAFMITHEMMHIIHHNTISTGESGDITNAGDPDVANQVQDSFINCKISRRYIGVEGIFKDRNGLAPMPKLGIGSKITVRGEHNNGLKKFEKREDLVNELLKVLCNLLKIDMASLSVGGYYNASTPMENLAGADIFITVDVKPTFSPIRDNGSNIFQRALDDILRVITEGKVHDKLSEISDAEKLSDLDVLPDGTLVLVKGTGGKICYTNGYHEDSNEYDLVVANISGVRKIKSSNETLCVTEYEKSDKVFGRRHRIQIAPYNPLNDAYVDTGREKKDKLSQEDLQKAQGNQPPMPQMPNMNQQNVKSLRVGDIVWIRKLRKFGRIVSADNGRFQIEEVIEKPAKVIDDSINY